jgi:uncharacterized protein (DUF362 family)
MKKKLSRRDFLKVGATGVGVMTVGALLDACGVQVPSQAPQATSSLVAPEALRSETSPPTLANPISTETEVFPTETSAPPPDVVVTRGGEPEALVVQAISALGGMEKIVKPGANVVIKPNICVDFRTYEYAATTNPYVVGALVKLALEAGAGSVKVMDSPFNGTQKKAYVNSGIQEQVEAAGGEMVYMSDYKFVSTENPAGRVLKKTSVYDDILKADVVINVPIAKHHSASRLTLGMKNLMGMIKDRNILHINLGQSIADLNALIKPGLTVIDAVRILTANGPTGGNLKDVKQLDTIVVSTDVVAADSYATSFFGMKPDDIDYLVAGNAMGLGRSDLGNMRIQIIQMGG